MRCFAEFKFLRMENGARVYQLSSGRIVKIYGELTK